MDNLDLEVPEQSLLYLLFMANQGQVCLGNCFSTLSLKALLLCQIEEWGKRRISTFGKSDGDSRLFHVLRKPKVSWVNELYRKN